MPSITSPALLGDLWRRYPGAVLGGLLLLIGALIYLPFLGSYPLWDPWEPHYTQVAWEMGQRDTWLNPFYRGRDNWWSKPIMLLWLLRISLALFWDHLGDFANHEFAARLPFALSAMAGGVIHFHWVSKMFGRRVGFIAGLILITTPQYLLMGRQVMIDVPHVVLYSASIGYLAVGLFTSSGRRPWPFICFWILQALAVLAKGFVAPVLAALILVGYGASTFRRPADVGGNTIGTIVRAFGGHAWRLLRRVKAGWGLILFFAVGAPWFLYMTAKHGAPYWNEWIFYHHLGRAAGTIDKPTNTFDYYIRHIFIGLLPWAGFLVAALFRFMPSVSALTAAGRRHLFLFMSVLMPFLFFSLSGTKFSHYIFPLLPFLGLIVALVLDELLPAAAPALAPAAVVEADKNGSSGEGLSGDSTDKGQPAATEQQPEPVSDARKPAHRPKHGRAATPIFIAVTLVTFAIVAHDTVLDFRHFLRLFLYYHSRHTPTSFFPFVALQVIYFPIGLLVAVSLFSGRFRRWQLTGVGVMAVCLSCYLSWRTMPAMQATYSFKPFLAAYQGMATGAEPIAQYNDWQQPVRSVIFLFQNRCKHIKSDRQVKDFLRRPGRKFILVDRSRLTSLRRIAREVEKKLYIVFDGHPYGRMVSDVPDPANLKRMQGNILTAAPANIQRNGANFEDKIEFIGYQLDSQTVKPGGTVTVTYYFKALALMDHDWQLFVHGDSGRGASARLHLDHYPMDGLYHTTEWQAGEIVRDTFKVEVPKNYKYDSLTLWTGFYRGERRMKLNNNIPSDSNGRVRGPLIRIDRS